MTTFAPNRDLTIEVRRIGQSAEPVLVIDDFLSDPEALVAAAVRTPAWQDLPPGGYPGRRAPLPAAYARAVLRRLDGPVRRRLLPGGLRMGRFDCAFSMVNRPPEALTALQRVPHIDIARPNRVAILHYLCREGFGGTAFYRQDATELEQIGPDVRNAYLDARAEGLAALGLEDAYPGADTPGYTRTGQVEARFNRLVAYRSFTLHSGIIDAPDRLTGDPATGRLTTTFFVDYDAPAED